MVPTLSRLLMRRRLRKVQAYWANAAETAADLDLRGLRAVRDQAQAMRQQTDRVVRLVDERLLQPPFQTLPRMPLGTDWVWRPEPWRMPLAAQGAAPALSGFKLCDGVTLFHDCPLGEVMVRQVGNRRDTDRAAFGLALDVFGFKGSFLSLAVSLPETALKGLLARHLVRVEALLDTPADCFARLNIRHGPNVGQMVCTLPATGGAAVLAEFDLSYAKVDFARMERAWVDVIFNDPAMSRIVLRDVVASRRPRAEL